MVVTKKDNFADVGSVGLESRQRKYIGSRLGVDYMESVDLRDRVLWFVEVSIPALFYVQVGVYDKSSGRLRCIESGDILEVVRRRCRDFLKWNFKFDKDLRGYEEIRGYSGKIYYIEEYSDPGVLDSSLVRFVGDEDGHTLRLFHSRGKGLYKITDLLDGGEFDYMVDCEDFE